jgi:hypothetical protein
MYLSMLPKTEQEQIVQALRGPQYDRKMHGGLFDRGSVQIHITVVPVTRTTGPKALVTVKGH